jgi:hypothetical protein
VPGGWAAVRGMRRVVRRVRESFILTTEGGIEEDAVA